MESTKPKPLQIENAHAQISRIYEGSKDLKNTESDLQDLSRNLQKMWGKYEMENIQSTVDHLFQLAKDRMESDHDKKVLVGLRQMVRELESTMYRPQPKYQDAFFFPNIDNIKKMQKYISMAKSTLDLAIFSFTNDDLANEILAAHQRGVKVRIITDDEAMKGKGADTQRMADAGIPCRTDSSEQYHMHNKFMLVDKTFLVTGSFNWTFQAGKSNQENVVVVDGKYYIDKYHEEFNKLWGEFSSNEVEQKEHKAATKIQKQFRANQAKKPQENRKKNSDDPWGL
jgi:phosphatidylserine/phosphatidylglycerophosphate/cardiolipin synthase-like enzyme